MMFISLTVLSTERLVSQITRSEYRNSARKLLNVWWLTIVQPNSLVVLEPGLDVIEVKLLKLVDALSIIDLLVQSVSEFDETC